MFARDTQITMAGGHSGPIGPKADLAPGTILLAATKGGSAEMSLTVESGEYVEVTTSTGKVIRCSPRAKLCLAEGGYAFAAESAGATVDTEHGPESIASVNAAGHRNELVSVRLSRVHAVLVNGFWFLVD